MFIDPILFKLSLFYEQVYEKLIKEKVRQERVVGK